MGYYTMHELEIKHPNAYDIYDKIYNDENNDNIRYALNENGESAVEAKWYDHEDDMRRISIQYPDAVFDLYGEGEEQGDIWHEFYKNGKMQRCEARIKFDPYDESKLE